MEDPGDYVVSANDMLPKKDVMSVVGTTAFDALMLLTNNGTRRLDDTQITLFTAAMAKSQSQQSQQLAAVENTLTSITEALSATATQVVRHMKVIDTKVEQLREVVDATRRDNGLLNLLSMHEPLRWIIKFIAEYQNYGEDHPLHGGPIIVHEEIDGQDMVIYIPALLSLVMYMVVPNKCVSTTAIKAKRQILGAQETWNDGCPPGMPAAKPKKKRYNTLQQPWSKFQAAIKCVQEHFGDEPFTVEHRNPEKATHREMRFFPINVNPKSNNPLWSKPLPEHVQQLVPKSTKRKHEADTTSPKKRVMRAKKDE